MNGEGAPGPGPGPGPGLGLGPGARPTLRWKRISDVVHRAASEPRVLQRLREEEGEEERPRSPVAANREVTHSHPSKAASQANAGTPSWRGRLLGF